MVEIIWYGHACFSISSRGVTVLTDPVPKSSGYDIGNPSADIVTVSHRHTGHAALDLVQPGYRLIDGPGEYEIQEVFINGIQTYHDGERGAKLGKNTVYVFEVDDLVICHLGDIGHVLTEQQVELVSSVDVLLVPAGGGPTITPAQAAEIIAQVEPGIVIPMQFRTGKGDSERESVDGFLKELASAEHETLERLRVRKSDIGESAKVVVLEPA
jgi:L-ascorbate metabolism protein UlaG (beta-lactamase superfamily)